MRIKWRRSPNQSNKSRKPLGLDRADRARREEEKTTSNGTALKGGHPTGAKEKKEFRGSRGTALLCHQAYKKKREGPTRWERVRYIIHFIGDATKEKRVYEQEEIKRRD